MILLCDDVTPGGSIALPGVRKIGVKIVIIRL